MRNQAFLPVWSNYLGISHILAIPFTDLDPVPSTYTVSGFPYACGLIPIRQVAARGGPAGVKDVVAIKFPDSEARLRQVAVPGAVPVRDAIAHGRNVSIRGAHIELSAPIDWVLSLLLYGAPTYGSNHLMPPVVTPPPTTTTADAVWSASTTFSTEPLCRFYDVDWVGTLEQTDPGLIPVSASVALDPALTPWFKVFTVQSSPVVTIGRPQADTFRFVKMTSGVIPPATYVNTITISATLNGVPKTITVDLELEI